MKTKIESNASCAEPTTKLELLNKGAVSAFEDEDGLIYFRMVYSNGHVVWLSDSTQAPYMYIVSAARHSELEMIYQTEILYAYKEVI